uniref:Uncharacterized protein n=1 Tax=Brassica oleracea var. oleracea TaxID=109376 RepID=A0A0D3AH11_BRAOL
MKTAAQRPSSTLLRLQWCILLLNQRLASRHPYHTLLPVLGQTNHLTHTLLVVCTSHLHQLSS